MLDINQIQEIIPHRPPFLLVDKIVEMEEGKRAVGIKNVTMNEPFFYRPLSWLSGDARCADYGSTGSGRSSCDSKC